MTTPAAPDPAAKIANTTPPPPDSGPSGGLMAISIILVVVAIMGTILYFGVRGGTPAKRTGEDPQTRSVTALMKGSDCFTCHRLDEPLIGPTWQQVAGRYTVDDDRVAGLVYKIKHGGKGVWGNVPMLGHPTLNEADIEIMVRWILDQRPAIVTDGAGGDVTPPGSSLPPSSTSSVPPTSAASPVAAPESAPVAP